MSSKREYSGIIWLLPRLFDWVMENKVKTLLIIGAVWYGNGRIQNALHKRAYHRQVIENRMKEMEQKLAMEERLKKNRFDQMTFRNMPSVKRVAEPSAAELKKIKEEQDQALFEEQVIKSVQNYSFSSRPILPQNYYSLDKALQR